MILYPRPKTGVTSKLRTRSSEITYGLPAVLIGRSSAKDAMQTAAAMFFKLVMMNDILILPFLQSSFPSLGLCTGFLCILKDAEEKH